MTAFAWPLCVCGALLILGLVILVPQRDAIGALIRRTKHIGKGGLTTSDTAALTTQKEVKPSGVEELLGVFENQLLVEQEKIILNFLSDKNILEHAERERVLLRYLANAQIVNRFEAVYAGVFGSQLRALEMLNQTPGFTLPTATLEGWYQVGLAGAPGIYGATGEKYAFGQWLGFMYRWSLIGVTGTDCHITLAGQEFLKYMIQNSYSMDRVG